MHCKRQNCPASGKVSLKCNKKYHFASLCQEKRPNHVKMVKDETDYDLCILSMLTQEGKGNKVLTKLTFCIEDNNPDKHKTSIVCPLIARAPCNVVGYLDLSIL